MSEITRYGVTTRWSDAVVHAGVAYFVEVPDDPTQDVTTQIHQVLDQVSARLNQLGSNSTRLLQTTIYLPNPDDLALFNEIWDQWVPRGHAPSRACIHAQLASSNYHVELVIVAAL